MTEWCHTYMGEIKVVCRRGAVLKEWHSKCSRLALLCLLHGHTMYLISYGTDTTSMVHRCESHSSFFREPYRVPWLLTYLLFYCTYNSFTLPFQGRTLNTHAAEANLRRFPSPQAPGLGAIQFLTTISKCKVARNFLCGKTALCRTRTHRLWHDIGT